MKKIFTFIMALGLGIGCASAQFTTGGKSSSGFNQSAGNSANTESYNMFSGSYTFNHFSNSVPSGFTPASSYGINGGTLTYLHGFSISNSYPMFIETGASIFFGGGTQNVTWEDYYYVYESTNSYLLANLAVPVNFAYRFNINDFFAIKPYLGLNAKINIFGKSAIADTGNWVNLFSKDDMGEIAWNRFQLGWHVGIDFELTKVIIGLEFGTDFIPAMNYEKFKTNSMTFNLRFGYLF